MNVTSIEEIRAQAEPDVIEIPGFRPGKTINVAVKPTLMLTPALLAAGFANPLIEKLGELAKRGKSAKAEELAGKAVDEKGAEAFMSLLDLVAREMLVQPTYQELTAISPLTLNQHMAIASHALASVKDLQFFRIR